MKIASQLKTNDQNFKDNAVHHQALAEEYGEVLDKIREGGGAQAAAKVRATGKLPVRERIQRLIDPNSSFLELSPLAGYEVYDDPVPAAGVITGIAKVSDRLCMVVANDPTVKGGTYFPMTVKKHLRAQEIAEKNHLPCIYLVDSGGAFLPKQDEVFPDRDHFGRIFYNQARMSAKRIPQISAVHGSCTAGGAYIPAMSDQTIIVKGNGTIFLGGPPLVKAATGEEVTAEDLGGAVVHTKISGVADHLAQDDSDALNQVRAIVRHLGKRTGSGCELQSPIPPAYPESELAGIIPRDTSRAFDVREILARIVDGSELLEFKAKYEPTLVTGFSHINGIPVGIIANNGILFADTALKGVHFIELCVAEQIPLLFVQNITGFMVGKRYEHAGIAKHGAKLVHVVATANVPKVTLIIGGSYGAGNYGMCGRAFDPDFLFTWPNSRVAVMGGAQAAGVLVTVKRDQLSRKGQSLSPEEEAAIAEPILKKYDRESHAYYGSARLWDDGIVQMSQTRNHLAMALSSTLYHEWQPTNFGVLRM